MPVWLNPLALAGLLASAGPVIVHLLRRERAPRIPFPSLRFVREARTAAVRVRLPSDIWLLVLRVAIIAGAAVALAQPLFVTPSRRESWDARVSRAVVVDVSPSMAAAGASAAEAAAAERRDAAFAVRIDAARLRDGLDQAVEALGSAPPSRREIVVVSDFQVGSLAGADVAAVPDDIGIRLVTVGTLPPAARFTSGEMLAAPGVGARRQQVHVTAEGTLVREVPAERALEGVRLLNAGPAADALLRAVALAGAPAVSSAQPLTVAFTASAPGAPPSIESPAVPAPPAVLRTLLALRNDAELAAAAREHRRVGTVAGDPWIVIARDADGAPVVVGGGRDSGVVLQVAGSAADYLAAATLRGALAASNGAPGWDEHEVERIPQVQRAAWTRRPEPPNPATWHRAAPGDARRVWAGVLVLLVVEAVMRRRRSRQQGSEVHAAAA